MLLQHGKIRTTEAKAKEIRKIAEGLIASAVKKKITSKKLQSKLKLLRKMQKARELKK